MSKKYDFKNQKLNSLVNWVLTYIQPERDELDNYKQAIQNDCGKPFSDWLLDDHDSWLEFAFSETGSDAKLSDYDLEDYETDLSDFDKIMFDQIIHESFII